MTINTAHVIEAAAQKGKAIASLLGTTCPLVDASREDLQTAFYALEGFFEEIMAAVEAESVGTKS